MKKHLFFLLTLAMLGSASAQSDRYLGAMKKNLAALDTAFRSPGSLLSLANQFERIALAEKNQWLPFYYAAFCQVNLGFMEQDKSRVDAIADKADALIARADSLQPGNSEISCIRSMVASCRMMVDPRLRWQQYGEASNRLMELAMQQDSSNPRPYLLRGQGLRYTPEQFGGGCKAALPALQTALEKFAAFVPASEIHPGWGRQIAQQLADGCQ